MTEALEVGTESASFIVLKLVESQFSEPIADKFSPVIHLRPARSRDKANLQNLIDGQGVFRIPPISTHKDPQLIGKRLPSGRDSNSGQSIQDRQKSRPALYVCESVAA
jgi:hypothetical protein